MRHSLARLGAALFAVTSLAAAVAALQPRVALAQVTIATYHGDNKRTGWNSQETALTAATVASQNFGLSSSTAVDDQVDAQPLIVPNVSINSGTHNVAYVATANDTIYAIDADSGSILLSRNIGTPVPIGALPGACSNNGPNVGIDSTPVADVANNVLYAMVDTYESAQAVFRLHEINLSTLTDQVPPVVVTASHKMSNGQKYQFQATYSRQRAGLLEANGNIYAGFASYCDIDADQSRGWVLGWHAGSLAPVPANQLDDRLASSPDNIYLSSVWMSGFGLAADPSGNLFYSTGNSDPNTYGQYNIQESVVKQAASLSKILSIFTPYNVTQLDQGDVDFGSGGVLVLPDQPGPVPHLAVAGGKDGRMFLLNRENLGGFTPGGPDKVVGEVNIGGCWCGESYFVGAGGKAHIVSSGGSTLGIWRLVTAPKDQLVLEHSASITNGQDGGFFTTVSSNGTQTAVIWAVGRPTNSNPANVLLYAFDASSAATLFTAKAGTWPYVGGNANIMPVVANGKVYVASYQNLSIFGLH
jgi:hypothetical protein